MSVLNRVVGAAGVAAVAFNIWVVAQIITSPGDDNPVAMLAAMLALAALWPASGLVWVERARPLLQVAWFVTSLPIIAAAVLLAAVLM